VEGELMVTIADLKADMDAKGEAYSAARAAYHKALCDANPIQPGDLIEVDMLRFKRGDLGRERVTKRYRVKRLRYSYKVELVCAEILANGQESAVEREVWRDYRKVEEPKP
jgi:hypothetical protein